MAMQIRTMFVNKCVRIKRFKTLLSQRYINSSSNFPLRSDALPDEENTNEREHTVLYNEHIPTSLLQKMLLTVGASVFSITDPFRHDMIAVLGETTGLSAAKKIRNKMLNNPEGSNILREKPRISSETINFEFLQSLPEDSFGHAYLKFLRDNNVTPDSRQPVHFVDEPELAYIIQRYREIHDLVHALLGMPTNMLGEVSVKWIEAIQTGLPMCIAGAVLGPLRFRPKQRQMYLKSYLPWSINCGFKANFLMNIYFEKRWQQSLDGLREELNIPRPP